MATVEKGRPRNLRLRSAGCVIRTLREQRGISLGALARTIGWDKGRLSRYETNQVGLSVDAIEQIAHALELPPLVVALRCLKQIYPALSDATKGPGKILERVVAEVLAEHEG